MSIAAQLVTLAELANVDAKAKLAVDRVESLPAAAKKADAAAAKLKADLDALTSKKTAAGSARKNAENEIADEKAKIRKWEARANELRGEREHAALTSEISGARKAIKRLEDTVLEQMEVIESCDKDIASTTKKHASALADASAEWAKVEGDIAAVRAEADSLAASRKVLLARLPAPVVKRYETIASKRAGVGVALVRASNDSCSACNRAIPPQMAIQIQKGLVLESCNACQRLLVHESMTQAPADESTPA